MVDIDWNFISNLEGGQHLNGYVPAAKRSQSGVTIATGFDIGQRSVSDLNKIGLPQNLITRFAPYTNLRGQTAVGYLAAHPLSVTRMQANTIDQAAKMSHVAALTKEYDKASKTGVPFSQLPREAQTVIASVAFQYGTLRVATPTFWGYVTRQDWGHAIKELRNFKDAFPTRRNKEADLLEKLPTNAPGRMSDEAR